jgi:transposase
MRRFRLNSFEKLELEKQLSRTHDARLYRRVLALLEIAQGRRVVDLSKLLRVTPRSIYDWMHFYQTGGISRLFSDSLSEERGRPTRWTQDLEEMLEVTLSYSPEQLGYSALNWTVPLLQQHFMQWKGERFSDATIRRELHYLGYVWKRPRYILTADPQTVKKSA